MGYNDADTENGRRRSPARKVVRIIGLAVAGVLLASFFALLVGFLVKWLWNWLMPELFGLAAITYWQAFGLVLLAKLLFGGFGHYHHDRGRIRDKEANGFRGSFWNHGHSSKFRPYDQYWREEGRDAFDAWLKRTGVGGSAREEERTGREPAGNNSGE